MAELQRLLEQNGSLKSELMQAFLTPVQVNIREHQQKSNVNENQKSKNIHNKKKQHMVSKSGIIEDLDNVRLGTESTSPTDNQKTFSPAFTTTSEFSGTDNDKSEPALDNRKYGPVTDSSNNVVTPSMTGAASTLTPGITPEMTKMTPDIMQDSSANLLVSDANGNEIDVERILEMVKQVPSALRQQLIDHVITSVSEAHLTTVTPTVKKVAEAEERIAKKKLEGKFPDFSKMPADPSLMWQKFVSNMTFEISQAVNFCKKLPGFGEIGQDDQMVLIKKGSFEILLCRMCLLVDHVHQEMFDPTMEMKCPRMMVKKMPMGMFIDEFFDVASQLNPLKLTDEELGIFSAALIMCPVREGVKNVHAVEKLNTLFLQSLYHEMRKNHNDIENKFARLLSVIPVFRSVNQKHSVALNSMKMQKAPPINDFPELHKEVYDLKDA